MIKIIDQTTYVDFSYSEITEAVLHSYSRFKPLHVSYTGSVLEIKAMIDTDTPSRDHKFVIVPLNKALNRNFTQEYVFIRQYDYGGRPYFIFWKDPNAAILLDDSEGTQQAARPRRTGTQVATPPRRRTPRGTTAELGLPGSAPTRPGSAPIDRMTQDGRIHTELELREVLIEDNSMPSFHIGPLTNEQLQRAVEILNNRLNNSTGLPREQVRRTQVRRRPIVEAVQTPPVHPNNRSYATPRGNLTATNEQIREALIEAGEIPADHRGSLTHNQIISGVRLIQERHDRDNAQDNVHPTIRVAERNAQGLTFEQLRQNLDELGEFTPRLSDYAEDPTRFQRLEDGTIVDMRDGSIIGGASVDGVVNTNGSGTVSAVHGLSNEEQVPTLTVENPVHTPVWADDLPVWTNEITEEEEHDEDDDDTDDDANEVDEIPF